MSNVEPPFWTCVTSRPGPILLGLFVTTFCVWFLSKPILWAVDIVTGRERIVAIHQLPSKGRIEVFQYWNGDFYNLNLRHVTDEGEQYECVIDPDCFRISSCLVHVGYSGELIITARYGIAARYRYGSKELITQNGILIRAEPAR